MNAAWLTAATALAVAAAAALSFAGRWTWRALTRVRDFLDDWAGQPARPGVPEHPGVMARLHEVEEAVAKVLAETRPNGGNSLRDVVHRTATDVTGMKDTVEKLSGRVELFEHQREDREGT